MLSAALRMIHHRGCVAAAESLAAQIWQRPFTLSSCAASRLRALIRHGALTRRPPSPLAKLSGPWKPRALMEEVHNVMLGEVIPVAHRMLSGLTTGRTVVSIDALILILIGHFAKSANERKAGLERSGSRICSHRPRPAATPSEVRRRVKVPAVEGVENGNVPQPRTSDRSKANMLVTRLRQAYPLRRNHILFCWIAHTIVHSDASDSSESSSHPASGKPAMTYRITSAF